MEKIDLKSLDSFIGNMIEYATVGEIKRYLDSLYYQHKKIWRENLPDLSEIKPNKIKSFDTIILIVYPRFMINDNSYSTVINALKNFKDKFNEKLESIYMDVNDFDDRIEELKAEHLKEKEEMLKELRNLNRK